MWRAIVAVWALAGRQLMRGATSKDTKLPVPLRCAEEQFQRWRKTRPRGTLIPERLWSLAMELAATYGVCKTASTLKLDYYGLKRRLGESTSAAACNAYARFDRRSGVSSWA